MNWLILIVAGLFEVVWATALKMSNGFRNPLADVVCAVGMALSVWLLAIAMKTIPNPSPRDGLRRGQPQGGLRLNVV